MTSTTKVSNLNVDSLDGQDWASPAAIGSGTPAAGSFTTIAASGHIDVNANIVGDGGGTLTGMLDTVAAKTAAYTLTLADCGKVLTNYGTSANVAITAGSDVTVAGYYFGLADTDGTYTMSVDCDDGAQFLGVTDAQGDKVQTSAQGDYMFVECVTSGSHWAIKGSYGTLVDGN